MKNSIRSYISVVVAGVALLLSACTSGISTRIQEKSALFDQFTPEVQKKIREGTIEPGYTADMVYMALGNPSKTKIVQTSHGKVGLWIYHNAYPEGYDVASSSTGSADDKSKGQLNSPQNTNESKGGEFKETDSAIGKKNPAPAVGVVASDTNEEIPVSSAFSSVGSSDYGFAKTTTDRASYTDTGLRGSAKRIQANADTFSSRSGAMEALDVPDMDASSLYIVFVNGRVAQMKLGRN